MASAWRAVLATWSIRRYASALADTRGILAVEQRTFHECPYSAEELRARLAAPEQRVWLADAGGQVVGFAVGMRTSGLGGTRLEVDLLAVDPDWQRRGLATALLHALRRDAGDAQALRGVANLQNPASSGAFARAGFVPSEGAYDLLLYRIRGRVPRPMPEWGGAVRALQSREDAAQLAALAPKALPPGDRIWSASLQPRVTLLVAAVDGTIVAGAELLEVHTVLYSGFWLESIHTGQGQRQTQTALIAAAVEAAKERGLDEVGCLVSQNRWPLRAALLAEGFAPLDSYRIWTAPPLPAEAATP